MRERECVLEMSTVLVSVCCVLCAGCEKKEGWVDGTAASSSSARPSYLYMLPPLSSSSFLLVCGGGGSPCSPFNADYSPWNAAPNGALARGIAESKEAEQAITPSIP